MQKIKIEDIPHETKISRDELKKVMGGASYSMKWYSGMIRYWDPYSTLLPWTSVESSG